MRSYILAVAVAMLLSAVYAFQNGAEITVQFLMFSRKFPQGVWEVIVFSVGAFLMWFFSIIASVEIHTKHTKQLKERDKRIAELEDEKKSLLTAFNHIAPGTDPLAKPDTTEEALPVAAEIEHVEHAAEEPLPCEKVQADGEEHETVTSDRDSAGGDFVVTEADGESIMDEEEEPTEGEEEKESSFI